MSENKINCSDIEKYINLDSDEYYRWDKGDCSLTGLLKILLVQELKNENKDLFCPLQKEDNNRLILTLEKTRC